MLFITDINKEELWEMYLNSFPEGTNQKFRKRREFDCSCCKKFVKSFGNVITLKDGKIVSIWDFEARNTIYQPVISALSSFVKSAQVCDVFVTKESGFGTNKNYEQREDGTVHTWEHFRIDLPQPFVTQSRESEASLMSEFRDVKNVFKRSLEEISKDAVETVLDLITQKSLYKGEEWQGVLTQFLALHRTYHALPESKKDFYCWENFVKVGGGAVSKIRNHSIGTLLIDVTNGIELNKAVCRYETIVAPTNYKRPKAVFTKIMVERAQQTITELGFLDSLSRRFATIDDIMVNNVLFANRDALKRTSSDVFAELQQEVEVSENPKCFDRVKEVPAESFVKDILPRLTSVEVLFENRHTPNLVSLIAPKIKETPSMFKWPNGFSWAYNGNITDSIKQRVKALGGNVNGVLRFSLQWNENGDDQNDLDAHCKEPNGNYIYFANKGSKNHGSTGTLDIDIQFPGSNIAVENIIWTDASRMQEGIYTFYVHNFQYRGGHGGFRAEIEYNGQVYAYQYNNWLQPHEKVMIAKLHFSKKDGIKFIKSLASSDLSKTVWNIQTNHFHPVSICLFSPNYWDEQIGNGHRHYFFILKNCMNNDRPNGFFNEFLRENLLQHKRVFEVLGSKMRVEQSDNQLSGLGFSSTQKNSVICRVKGHTIRIMKVMF